MRGQDYAKHVDKNKYGTAEAASKIKPRTVEGMIQDLLDRGCRIEVHQRDNVGHYINDLTDIKEA